MTDKKSLIKKQEVIALLKEAQAVLSSYWFSSDGEEEYNNDEVIELDKKIQAFLNKIGVDNNGH